MLLGNLRILMVLRMGFRIICDGSATDHIHRVGEDILMVRRIWQPNNEFFFIVEYDFEPSYWMVPGIVYCGNRVGRGKFPRPSLDEPWFFREDRCSIPSAGIVESEDEVLMIFAEPAKSEEELSAVGVMRNKIIIRIPWMETPYRYVGKNRFVSGERRYFSKAKEYERNFYIVYGRYRDRGYRRGYYLAVRRALEILGGHKEIDHANIRRYIESRISYALNIHYCEFVSRCGFVQFVLCGTPISSSSVSGGFVGRSMDLALALYRVYLISGDTSLKRIAFSVADAHCYGLKKCGLLYTDYFISTWKRYGFALLHRKSVNTRILGETLYSMLRLYEYARRNGEERRRWLLVPLRVGLFFAKNQLPSGGYGCWWDEKRVIEYGTNGVYIVWVMAKLYELTGNKIFLKSAERAMDYYAKKFVEKDIYYGDTLDSDTIDKEGAHAILKAALLLYETTKKEKYVEIAGRAAYFLATWVMLWDVPFGENAFLGSIGFRTKGWTIVSVENQHLDPYGLIIAPDMLRLHLATGEKIWRDLALLMAAPVLEFVFPWRKVQINRIFYGYQPEQINHTDWSYTRILGTICQLVLFGKPSLRRKGTISNSILWTVSGTVNAALDLAELLGIKLEKIKIWRDRSVLHRVFKAAQKIFVTLNIVV